MLFTIFLSRALVAILVGRAEPLRHFRIRELQQLRYGLVCRYTAIKVSIFFLFLTFLFILVVLQFRYMSNKELLITSKAIELFWYRVCFSMAISS